MDKIDEIVSISEQIEEILQKAKNKNIPASHKLLQDRLKNPKSFVCFIGETSSGKSTIINGLFNQYLLPTDAIPTTGTITQIYSHTKTGKKESKFFKMSRKLSLSKIDRKSFEKLSVKPDTDTKYLYVETKAPDKKYTGFLIVDTPGFNSVITEHEEVLIDFMPQSDVIVFTVDYRIGFLQPHKDFMELIYDILKEIDEEIPILLAINRCPNGATLDNKRVLEISKHASDTIKRDLPVYLINSVVPKGTDSYIYPRAEQLWNDILRCAKSKERQKLIIAKSKNLMVGLMDEIEREFEEKLLVSQLRDEDISALKNIRKELNANIKDCYRIADEEFEKLSILLHEMINKEVRKLQNKLEKEVKKTSKLAEKHSCTAYIEKHVIPFGVRSIGSKVEKQTKESHKELDKKINEMANLAIRKMNTVVMKSTSPDLSKLIVTLNNSFMLHFGRSLASTSLKRLGGVGGYAAGAGNLTKMVVSRGSKAIGIKVPSSAYIKIGRFFNKAMLIKIGEWSGAVLIISQEIQDIFTWKKSLINKSNEELEKKRKEFLESVKKSVKRYKSHQNKLLKKIFEENDLELVNAIKSEETKISKSEREELSSDISLLQQYKEKMVNI